MTTPKKPKAVKAWAVVTPAARKILEIGFNRKDTLYLAWFRRKACWCGISGEEAMYHWQTQEKCAERKGYRCIRVLITPIENE